MQLSAPCHQNTSGSEWGWVEDVPVPEASVQSGAAPQLSPHPLLDPRSFQPSRPCPVLRAAPAPALPTPPSGSSCSSSTPQPPAHKPPQPTQTSPSRRDTTARGLGAGTAKTHPALGSVPLKSKGGGTGGQQSSLVARWEHLQGVWAFPPAPRCTHAPWPPTQGPLPSPLISLPKAEAQEDPKAFGIPRRTFPSSSYAPPWARAQPRSRPTWVPAEHLPPLHPCAASLPFFRKR